MKRKNRALLTAVTCVMMIFTMAAFFNVVYADNDSVRYEFDPPIAVSLYVKEYGTGKIYTEEDFKGKPTVIVMGGVDCGNTLATLDNLYEALEKGKDFYLLDLLVKGAVVSDIETHIEKYSRSIFSNNYYPNNSLYESIAKQIGLPRSTVIMPIIAVLDEKGQAVLAASGTESIEGAVEGLAMALGELDEYYREREEYYESLKGPIFKVSNKVHYDEAFKVLDIVNEERATEGLTPLEMDSNLLKLANQRGAEISFYYSHTRPNGEPWSTLIKQGGIRSEIIAVGYGSAAAAMNGWMNSEGHRKNILTPGFRYMGVSAYEADGEMFWVQVFSNEKESIAPKRSDVVTETHSVETLLGQDIYFGENYENRSDYFAVNIDTVTEMKTLIVLFNTNWYPIQHSNLDPDIWNWSSSNTGVATVDEKGRVTAKKAGKTTITVTNKNKPSVKASATVEVFIPITKATVTGISDKAYTGQALTQNISVSFNGTALQENRDFEVQYSNNKEEGTATVKITGKGSYNGSVARTFKITHSLRKVAAKAATCTVAGNVEYWHCNGCNKNFSNDNATNEVTTTVISPLGHNYGNWTETKAASCTAKGEETRTCKRDASHKETRDIVALGHSYGEWAVTKAATTSSTGVETRICMHDSSHTETRTIAKLPAPGSDPKQKAKDGTATGAGASEAAANKAITSSASDEGPTGSKFAPLLLRSSSQGNNNINLTWSAAKGAKKYVVYGNACGKKNKMKKLATVTGKKYNVKKIAKKLKKGTYHKFMVVALDKNNNVVSTSKVIHVATKGNKKNANPTKLTVKKTKVSIKKGKTFKIGAKQVGKNVKNHRGICYESSNAKIASVNAKGVVTAKKKGTCYVYAYAQNGIYKKIQVVVK